MDPGTHRSVPASSRVTVPGCKCVRVRGGAPSSAPGSAGLSSLGGPGWEAAAASALGREGGERGLPPGDTQLPARWCLGLCQADSCGPSWPLARVTAGQRSGRGLLLNATRARLPRTPAAARGYVPQDPPDGPDYCFDDSRARPGDQGPTISSCSLPSDHRTPDGPCCSLCLSVPILTMKAQPSRNHRRPCPTCHVLLFPVPGPPGSLS